jgi:hypothetical protein
MRKSAGSWKVEGRVAPIEEVEEEEDDIMDEKEEEGRDVDESFFPKRETER